MGERSNESGQIGENLTNNLLLSIGWMKKLHNISIKCHDATHLNERGNQKSTHGIDQFFIYNNPFHDDLVTVVYVSVKNTINTYPSKNKLRNDFKSHLEDIQSTIQCGKLNPDLNKELQNFNKRKNIRHVGLLVWLQNDIKENKRSDIKPELSNINIDSQYKDPIYLIDDARALFITSTIKDIKSKAYDQDKLRHKEYCFYYPDIGTFTSKNLPQERMGDYLPLELIVSDIIVFYMGVRNKETGRFSDHSLVIYTTQLFSEEAYRKLVAYSLVIARGLVQTIYIGMPDYNPVTDRKVAARAANKFNTRMAIFEPFSFNVSTMDNYEDNKS